MFGLFGAGLLTPPKPTTEGLLFSRQQNPQPTCITELKELQESTNYRSRFAVSCSIWLAALKAWAFTW